MTTHSFTVERKKGRTKTVRLSRMGTGPTKTTSKNVLKARSLAARYIMSAQNKDGSFVYTLDPLSGEKNTKSLVLPRHGGTTLALCELDGESKRLKRVVRRATRLIEGMHQKVGALGYFTKHPNREVVDMRNSTLPTVALMRCAKAGLIETPKIWKSLAEFLLGQQRENGSFYPEYNAKSKKPQGNYEVVFGAGQAIYALVLMEEHLASTNEDATLQTKLHEAVESAMAYYSGEYWDKAPSAFFFLEENWHCIAARAGLRVHRHAAYERFCLDYVTFKSRFIQTSKIQGFQGGMTLSPLFVPHATATSGYGEAAAAALALADARGESRKDIREKLRLALGYLVQTQLREETCFACKNARAYGGFTESAISGSVRIDFVQHAMAALGHGHEVLELGKDR